MNYYICGECGVRYYLYQLGGEVICTHCLGKLIEVKDKEKRIELGFKPYIFCEYDVDTNDYITDVVYVDLDKLDATRCVMRSDFSIGVEDIC